MAVLLLDQATKLLVLRWLGPTQGAVVIEGFFRFVHWGNTGAAWSLFRDRNGLLAIVSFWHWRPFSMAAPFHIQSALGNSPWV